MNTKPGLVLGGGGSRGSYEVGIIRALNEKGLSFPICTGTSIGSIVGAVYTQDPHTDLTEWMGGFTSDQIDSRLFLFPNQYDVKALYGKSAGDFFRLFTDGGPSFSPMEKRLAEILDYDKFRNSETEFACVSYNVTRQAKTVFGKNDISAGNYPDVLLASSAYFPAFNIKKLGSDDYIDGGYCDTVPVDVARRLGADTCVIVDLSDDGSPLPQLRPGDLFIRPIRHLAYFLDFDGNTLKQQAQQGYLDGLKFLDMAPGYLYTFYADDWDYMKRLEKTVLDQIVAMGKASLLEKLPEALEEIYAFLFGWQPRKLENKYSEQFVVGRLFECMGVIAGIDMNEQIHFKDFLKKIMAGFGRFTQKPDYETASLMGHNMELKGLDDMLAFFHSALVSFDDELPEQFDIFKQKYVLPYYLAFGWRIMEKYRLLLQL